jgi:predicted DNA-binding transcriptional regulator YafY
LWGTFDPDDYPVPELTNESVTLEITKERNTLERAMLQFSYLAKRTERIGEKTFRMTLQYRQEDETELLIKILSFGPMMKVVEPASFISLIRERIDMQSRRNFV